MARCESGVTVVVSGGWFDRDQERDPTIYVPILLRNDTAEPQMVVKVELLVRALTLQTHEPPSSVSSSVSDDWLTGIHWCRTRNVVIEPQQEVGGDIEFLCNTRFRDPPSKGTLRVTLGNETVVTREVQITDSPRNWRNWRDSMEDREQAEAGGNSDQPVTQGPNRHCGVAPGELARTPTDSAEVVPGGERYSTGTLVSCFGDGAMVKRRPTKDTKAAKPDPRTAAPDRSPNWGFWLEVPEWPLQIAVDLVHDMIPVDGDGNDLSVSYLERLTKMATEPCGLFFEYGPVVFEGSIDQARMLFLKAQIAIEARRPRLDARKTRVLGAIMNRPKSVVFWVDPWEFGRWAQDQGVSLPVEFRRWLDEHAAEKVGSRRGTQADAVVEQEDASDEQEPTSEPKTTAQKRTQYTENEQTILLELQRSSAIKSSTQLESRTGLSHAATLDTLHALEALGLVGHKGKRGGWYLTSQGQEVARSLSPHR